jgi:hypothetical protein
MPPASACQPDAALQVPPACSRCGGGSAAAGLQSLSAAPAAWCCGSAACRALQCSVAAGCASGLPRSARAVRGRGVARPARLADRHGRRQAGRQLTAASVLAELARRAAWHVAAAARRRRRGRSCRQCAQEACCCCCCRCWQRSSRAAGVALRRRSGLPSLRRAVGAPRRRARAELHAGCRREAGERRGPPKRASWRAAQAARFADGAGERACGAAQDVDRSAHSARVAVASASASVSARRAGWRVRVRAAARARGGR